MYKKALSVFLVFTCIGICANCSKKDTEGDSEKIIAAASILPLVDFTEQIGGKYVEVEVLVPPGSSPHTYTPTPAQLQRLSRAKLLILNGVGLEFWAEKVIKGVENPDLMVVYTSEGLDIIDESDQARGRRVQPLRRQSSCLA